MKVLHLLRKNTHLRASFIQNQIINHIEFEPHVIYCEERDDHFDGGFADNVEIDIPIHSIADNPKFLARYAYKYLKLLSKSQKMKLHALVHEIKPDVIHLHYGTDAGIYLAALADIKIPKIVSFYGYDCYSFPKRFFGLGKIILARRVFQHLTKALAMSPAMKQDLLSIGCPENKIQIHYHGVPTFLSSINKTGITNQSTFSFLMLSYLDPVKGHDFVFNALRLLIDRGVTNFKLKIVGDGHFRKILFAKVVALKLQLYVEFFGRVNYLSQEYFNTFIGADIFLHPSVKTKHDKEGIPGSLVEAMFAGLPVIATRHGGIPYVIEDHKTGLLVEENDTNALAESIYKLMVDDSLREKLAKEAKAFAMRNLDIMIRESALETIYSECIIYQLKV